jgi:hypothetical protein
VLAYKGQTDDMGTFRNREGGLEENQPWGIDIPLDSSQVFQYYVATASDSLDLWVSGYMDEL